MPKFFHHRSSASTQPGKPVVTPDFRTTGQIKMVNLNAGYVIVNFPETGLPFIGQRLSVYRHGQKMGELKVTGPEPRDGNAAADIIAGEVQVGDEARTE